MKMNRNPTIPAESCDDVSVHLSIPNAASVTKETVNAPFEKVKHLLSDKPLQRPLRNSPMKPLTNESLLKAATKHSPPDWWLSEGEESPFVDVAEN